MKRNGAKRNGAERSEAEWSEAEWSVMSRVERMERQKTKANPKIKEVSTQDLTFYLRSEIFYYSPSYLQNKVWVVGEKWWKMVFSF